MIPDTELEKILKHCDREPNYFSGLALSVQTELRQYCRVIIKYGGTTHELSGGKVFTDNTLLKPAKRLVKSLKKTKLDKGK